MPPYRKSVVSLVCKGWWALEATVPQHPTSIHFDASQPKSRAALQWLVKEGFQTSRLQAVTIKCPDNWGTANQDSVGCIHALLTILGAKPSPLIHLDISNFESQPGSNLLDSLVRLRNLKELKISCWHYTSSDIPALAELSNLQQLQDLSLQRAWPNAGCEDNLKIGCLPFWRALQRLTALTKLDVCHAYIVCPLFDSNDNFCTQLRSLHYVPGSSHQEVGTAACLRNMAALTSLHIQSSSTDQQAFLPSLHVLKDLVLSVMVKHPILISDGAKLTSLELTGASQLDNLGYILPLATLRNLEWLDIRAGRIGDDGLPAFWSQLTNLTSLSLPRLEFLPNSLAALPGLRTLKMETRLGEDPLGTKSLLSLLESLPQLTKFEVLFEAPTNADATEFIAEISRVQQLVSDVRIFGICSLQQP